MSWADQFNTYQDACDFYGCDGPRELAIEARIEAEIASIQIQDEIEAGGVQAIVARHYSFRAFEDEIPF